MAQTAAIKRQVPGATVDYTPASAVTGGDVVALGDLLGIASGDIAANTPGTLDIEGVFDLPKTSDVFAVGDNVYWSATGTPVTGTAGSGAASLANGQCIGEAVSVAVTGASYVSTKLLPGRIGNTTVAVGGTAQANANAVEVGFTLVTGANDTAAIVLPAAAAGKVCIVKNGVANKILKVFPAVGDKINGAAANAVYNQTNGSFRTYVAYNAVDWYTDPEVIA